METQKAKEEAISRRLIQRAEDTVTNQSCMLSSILDRDFRRIVIDRIVTVDSNNIPTLHTNPDDIFKIAPTQFRALTHPRQHQFDSLTPEWASVYFPLQHVNDNIYQSLMDPPTFREWNEALNKCSLNTAPGISGITYLLIKNYIQQSTNYSALLLANCILQHSSQRIGKRLRYFQYQNPQTGNST